MNSIEIKVLGQSFLINPPGEEHDYYRAIASDLDKKLHDLLVKSQLRSDVKAAVQMAFMLTVENERLKAKLKNIQDFEYKIDECISKLDI